MITGILANITTAVILVTGIHVFYESSMELAGFIPVVPSWVVTTHRAVAVITFLVMLAMLYTGAKRMRSLHIKLHIPFIMLYLIVYFSGLFIFKGA